MTFRPNSLFVRARTLLALVAPVLRRVFRVHPHIGDFASQRMCPFCSLITPRYKTCCLECGKSFKPAWTINDFRHDGQEASGNTYARIVCDVSWNSYGRHSKYPVVHDLP